MALKNYTADEPIIRGSKWPPADDVVTVTVTKGSGWPGGSDSWTWELAFATRGGTSVLDATSASAGISGNDMVLTFSLTVAQTALLVGGKPATYKVELKSTNGAVVSYYDDLAGEARVRDPFT
jgi:hypothetical protein